MQISNLALEGMQRATASVDRTAGKIAQLPLDAASPKSDSLDLSQEMVALLVARQGFDANAKAAQTGGQMNKTLLDILR